AAGDGENVAAGHRQRATGADVQRVTVLREVIRQRLINGVDEVERTMIRDEGIDSPVAARAHDGQDGTSGCIEECARGNGEGGVRSEERRVGKEGGERWEAYEDGNSGGTGIACIG